ncbi:MAG: Hpt domain-containing protein [Oscillospiraceae bacterium]
MDDFLVHLKDYGGDMEGAMVRFVGDTDLYKTCFATFLADVAFPDLGIALQAADYKRAFECAHTLKGVVGNMGLTPLYTVICHMVENLRSQDYSQLDTDYAEILRQLEFLKTLA